MHNAVVIKSSKAGMTVILDPGLPFDELLEAIAKKFSESARFWGSVQMTLTLEGRSLTAAEEFEIVDTITRNSQIEILCLLDTDAERIERCEKALNDKLMELNSQTGQFYRGSLKKGDSLAFEKTDLYQQVFRLAEKKAGKTLPREMLPGIQLESPKITRNLTTAWFAKRVDERRANCMARR